jgi:MbtH protein
MRAAARRGCRTDLAGAADAGRHGVDGGIHVAWMPGTRPALCHIPDGGLVGSERSWLVSEEADDRIYAVVVNHEEQYSIWLAGADIPAGWQAEGTTGTRQQCLDHIDQVWTDMRPLSLRLAMGE